MAGLGSGFTVLYVLISIGLWVVALLAHINSRTLSLPLSPALTITALLLPIVALANSLYYSHSAPATSRRPSLAAILQTLQGLVLTVLATIFSENLPSGVARDCGLSTRWQKLFVAKDAEALRRIQDAFACCGFNSVHDRAWPFVQRGAGPDCTTIWSRDQACRVPWTGELVRWSGAELGVVLGFAVMQLAVILLGGRAGEESIGRSWLTSLFGPRHRTWTENETSPSRPLLGAPRVVDEEQTDTANGANRVDRGDYGTRRGDSHIERNAWEEED